MTLAKKITTKNTNELTGPSKFKFSEHKEAIKNKGHPIFVIDF